eukprot:scaffold85500_cov38-Prasinocladus_malaysianus.AAC.1
MDGDNDDISQVIFTLHDSFKPQSFVKNMAEFATKQTSFGAFTAAKVQVRLSDNSIHEIDYPLNFSSNGGWTNYSVPLHRSHPSFYNVRQLPLPTDLTFGVELELTTGDYGLDGVADIINDTSGHECDVDYDRSRDATPYWRVTTDSSVHCGGFHGECQAFELVSPILRGGKGLQELHSVLQAVNRMGVHADNPTAGFHVHVGVGHLSLEQLKKVCQSFVKYEEAFDMMVPRSRRDNEYCMSNRFSGRLGDLTNKQANDAIAHCQDMDELHELMNPDNSKHYKLSLMPVASGRQPTV